MTTIIKPVNWMVKRGGDCRDPHLKNKYAPVGHEHNQYIAQGSVLDNISVDTEDLLYSPADHTHNEYLQKGEIAEKSYALNQVRSEAFSSKDHIHDEYQTII